MRLSTYRDGRTARHRAFLGLTRLVRAEVDDVGKVAMRRPDLFGRPFLALVQDVMRGPSPWSLGEREFLAAVVSATNDSDFCVGTHGTQADRLLGDHRGWEDGRFGPRVTAAARLAQGLARGAQEATDLVGPARAAGVSEDALEDVVDIVFVFSLVNRLSNALGFDYRSETDRRRNATILRHSGYRLPSALLH
jgi:alkylhydroperoxidase family enzyme